MPAPDQSIFRESAVKKHRQRQEQGVLLRVYSPPVWALCWIVLLLLFGAVGFAWSVTVPVSVQGQGVVIEQGPTGQAEGEVVAILFFSPGQLAGLHVGQPATVSIGSTSTSMAGSVEQVGTALISPSEARSRYNLQGGLAQVITGPSLVVTISIGPAASARIFAGSLCDAQIQIGSQRVLSLLPGFNQMRGK